MIGKTVGAARAVGSGILGLMRWRDRRRAAELERRMASYVQYLEDAPGGAPRITSETLLQHGIATNADIAIVPDVLDRLRVRGLVVYRGAWYPSGRAPSLPPRPDG